MNKELNSVPSAGTKAENSTTADITTSSQPIANTHVVRRFFDEMSKKHNVDLDALNVHITNGQIYVQKYTPGHIDMFKLLEIL